MKTRALAAATPVALIAAFAAVGGCRSDASMQRERVDAAAIATPPETAPVEVTPEIVGRDAWFFSTVPGEVIRTRHYRLYTTERNELLKERLASFLEHALAHYRQALVPLPAPTRKLDTYLLDNRDQWANLTRRLMGAQAETLVGIQRGGYASQGMGVYYDLDLFDTIAISAHEGWHQYTQSTFRAALPVWLEEGIATYMEGHGWNGSTPVFRPWSNLERFDQLRRGAQEGTLLPFEELVAVRPGELIGTDEDRVLNYYAQVWALTHFLDSGADGRYAASLRTLVADAASGEMRDRVEAKHGRRALMAVVTDRTGIIVLDTYFTDDVDALAREYDAFVQELVRVGGRDAIVDGRSPLAVSAADPSPGR